MCALFAQPVDFVKQVEPILAAKCYGCHGPAKQTSGVRLDDGPSALAGGYGGKVILPGKSADSPLIHRVTGANGLKAMPMGSKGLPPEQVAILKAWIDQGAQYPTRAAAKAASTSSHWAFQPIRKPAGAIDSFIRATLAKQSLTPSKEADKPTLLRRLSLDLIGLPPTPAEMQAFLADASPNAY